MSLLSYDFLSYIDVVKQVVSTHSTFRFFILIFSSSFPIPLEQATANRNRRRDHNFIDALQNDKLTIMCVDDFRAADWNNVTRWCS